MYARVLKVEEIQAIYECTSASHPGEGDILNWKTAVWTVQGSVEEEDVNICQRRTYVSRNVFGVINCLIAILLKL